jgi:Cu/Ag efflux protein CusF
MWFSVKDKSMLDGIASNDKVEFTVTEEDSADVITELKKAQ